MGPQFHESGYGKYFFNSGLPKLINAIDRLAKAIEESNTLKKEERACSDYDSENVIEYFEKE